MVCDCCRNACVSKHTAQVRKQQEGVVSIRDCCSRRRTFVADEERKKNFVLSANKTARACSRTYAPEQTHNPSFTPPPLLFNANMQNSSHQIPNINRKPQLLSTFLTDEEPAEPAWHVSVAMTGLI